MSDPSKSKWQKRFGILGAALGGICLIWLSSNMCIRAYLRYGITVPYCPSGDPRPTFGLELNGARRGWAAWVRVTGNANYTRGPSDQNSVAGLTRLTAKLELTDPAGKLTALVPVENKSWESGRGWLSNNFVLPDGPDGDWSLVAKVESPLGPGEVKLKVPLYSPARIHVLTDRPLYQPGQVVNVRALALRASDLAPLDGRPGVFTLTSPNGEVVLEERAPLGEWGIAASALPLDPEAEVGDWRVSWVSGGAEESATFRVEPFVLPRFRVEATPSAATYRSGERPSARGTVRYASGAPVAGAQIAVQWFVDGAWPPPTDWMSTQLPKLATTDPAGRFTLDLPIIPRDLQGNVTQRAAIPATDETGDRVESGIAFLLSEDGIAVDAVTELEGGLVEGFNNRVYLRATTPDGAVLSSTDLVVKRAWEPSDKGISAKTDEDGVASVQLDPGPAVNVVIPPPPYRAPIKPPTIQRGNIRDLLSGEAPKLADQLALDRWPSALAPCARFTEGGVAVTLGLRVAPSGAVVAAADGATALERCLVAGARALKLAAGAERVYQLTLHILEPDLPSLSVSIEGVPDAPDGVEQALQTAGQDARVCLSRQMSEDSALPRVAIWRVASGGKAIEVSWAKDPSIEADSTVVAASVASCVEAKLSKLSLASDSESSGIGVARISASPIGANDAARPQATVMLGYELEVIAGAGKELIGKTKIRLNPGAVPQIRLRATPVLAKAGGTVEVELIRGPGFQGELPEKLYLSGKGSHLEALLDPKTRRATFEVPTDFKGWLEVTWNGARAMAFVPSDTALALSVRPEHETYKPGQKARIDLETKVGGKGTPAAVGLFGVDESLGQIAQLAGPDSLGKLRPKVNTPSPAFGILDGEALALGRVRGANAAQAIISRVGGLPPVDDVDVTVNARTQDSFDPIEALTDRFYTVLGQLHTEVRAWENSAPDGEKMSPKLMVKLFGQAITTLEKKGENVTDAYGQRLRLSQLPPDLLALCAPEAVVVTGTRLPEDVEDWAGWIQKERP